jgi:predicted DNA-binding antitoxin AbrB/MazE fold protein
VENMEIEAVYENGTLKLSRELPLAEGQKVIVTIRPAGSAVERLYGSVRWTRDPEELHRFLDDPDEGQWGSRDV